MRDWLGAGDCRSWDDAVLGVCCTRCQLMIMAWRDREGWLNFTFLGDGRVEHKKERRSEEMGEIIMRTWDLREVRVRVNWPSPIRQVPVPIRRVITLKRGLPNPTMQVILLISHSHSYPPYRFHLNTPSHSFLSTTLPSSQELNVKSSLSITPCDHHELTLNAAYTECSIYLVQKIPSAAYTYDCQSSLHSQDFEFTPGCSFSFQCTFLPIDRHQPVLHKQFKGKETSRHSHGFELTNRWIESQHLAHLASTTSRSTTSNYPSNCASQ